MIKPCKRCGADADHYESITSCCKRCWRDEVKARRASNVEAVRAYDRARAKTPERKAQFADKQRRRRSRGGPEYIRAHNVVTRALRSGALVRPAHCERCERADVQAHHDDHSRPLDLMWLCPVHHAQRHAELGRLASADHGDEAATP